MIFQRPEGAAGLLAALLFCMTGFSCSDNIPADLILVNGRIITVDSDFSIREAISVKGDRIL